MKHFNGRSVSDVLDDQDDLIILLNLTPFFATLRDSVFVGYRLAQIAQVCAKSVYPSHSWTFRSGAQG